jgi:hypothetical protein
MNHKNQADLEAPYEDVDKREQKLQYVAPKLYKDLLAETNASKAARYPHEYSASVCAFFTNHGVLLVGSACGANNGHLVLVGS